MEKMEEEESCQINSHEFGWRPNSISENSVDEIAKVFIDESLSDPVKHEICNMVRDWSHKFAIQLFEYVRWTRARKLECAHLYRQDLDLFVNILRVNKQPQITPREMDENELLRYTVAAVLSEKFNKEMQVSRSRKRVRKSKHQPETPATLPPKLKIIRNPSTRWIKHEQVYLKSCKQLLTEEQLNFYQLITETCVGPSEEKRCQALQTLSSDSSLDELLPTFCIFIVNAVQVNVAQPNMIMLLHLMRMVRVLVSNSSLSVPKCLHQLIPTVLTCLLTRQDSLNPALEDHWALREYAGNIMSEIVWHYNSEENGILPRVIGVYKSALQKQSLTTVYGAVIGLGKLGSYVIQGCLIPEIANISRRVEPYLKDTNGYNSNMNKLTSKYIRHRILKVCTPILMKLHSPPDELSKYAMAYGYLGLSLCDAVTVSRIKVAAISEAQKEAEVAELLAETNTNQQPLDSNLNVGEVSLNDGIQEKPDIETVNGNVPDLAQQFLDAPDQVMQDQHNRQS